MAQPEPEQLAKEWREQWEAAGKPEHLCGQNVVAFSDEPREDYCGVCGVRLHLEEA